uniref:ATP synthase F0 subunit 8 n=1 Tax=Halobates micans TaxID=109010 RepID=UPI002E75D385|nr:ATP synthase F0 subunit 8 [Halobates micans]WPW46713.1 ATP synthase F0 subunit 8 [Halobates micans]WPW46778.1 ATP synthase F0 subunit 8 [Halobates micans]WPW46804.1 ATP synthase F0 subunit 8 [Halobates micans]
MPQMAPLSWLTLMIMFIIMIIIINSMTYFNKNYKIEESMENKKMNQLNWKW